MDTEPRWAWPDDVRPSEEPAPSDVNSSSSSSTRWKSDEMPGGFVDEREPKEEPAEQEPHRYHTNRHYRPRQCRICLETVLPTFEPASMHIPTMLQAEPRVTYTSSDPELGKLIRPCKCKGSSRYVHEGCLQSWRHADPAYGRRNYFQCPTCGFQYRLQRIAVSRWISSALAQVLLTGLILLIAIFLLGFVADPIINLYVDPYDTIAYADYWHTNVVDEVSDAPGASGWITHLTKGLASLGVLSFVKVLLAMSPWNWWNLRNSSLAVGGGRNRGRDRVASISWVVIFVGVCTALWVSGFAWDPDFILTNNRRASSNSFVLGADAHWRELASEC